MTEFKSKSEKDTFEHGVQFSKKIKSLPTLILLVGAVGAGKTSWVKGFVWGYLKKKDLVTSSSYSLVNGYSHKNKEVIHFDLYRLQSEDDLESVGFWDYLTGEKVILVEWGDALKSIPKGIEVFTVKFSVVDEHSRILMVT